jgi:ectoine hydroxylase-related dioxygenase (phytanoyl-CoA dioxygenase family)
VNKKPLRQVSQQEIEQYQRDGVVCVRGMFDAAWPELLLSAFERIEKDPEECGLLPHSIAGYKHLWHQVPEFRSYAMDSPAAEVVGRVIGARYTRFFFDQVFAKEPGSTKATVWHNDFAGWPTSGEQIPSFWMALTPVVKANSLECIAGTHLDKTLYWNITNNSRHMIQPPDRHRCPDMNDRRDDPNLEFLSWDMEPGDALVIHPRTLHYSGGNPTAQRRVALSTRWAGSDIVWKPRPECINLPKISFDEMIAGETPSGDLFPLVWEADK